VLPLIVPELLEASEAVGVLEELLELLEFALSVVAASFVVDAPGRLAPEVLSNCTSPFVAWVVFALGLMLPVRGTHGAALVTPAELLVRAALSAGRLPDAVVVRLPVVVVSAPTPEAPLVALSPVKRLSGLVDVLFGVVLAATPAVVPASVGVPVAAVGAAVVGAAVVGAAVVGAAVVGAAVVAPLVLVVAGVP
jgi:hypothetical protein